MSPVIRNRILCVDDSEDCELLSVFLKPAGFEVESAESFQEALESLKKGEFDLCFANIPFVDGQGAELLEEIQGANLLTPLIISSADARPTTEQKAMHAGAKAFFVKPIDYDALLEVIPKIIKQDS